MVEKDIEEILRKDTRILFDGYPEEDLLIFDEQLTNSNNNRLDLSAIDSHGNIVIIEVKRDKKDIKIRSEPIEFQAFRYASSFLENFSLDECKNHYKSYVEKHEPQKDAESVFEGFIKEHHIDENTFNKKQRILLVASDFDQNTLAAVSWLIQNNIDIACCRISPHKIEDGIILKSERILPLKSYNEYIPKINLSSKLENCNKTITPFFGNNKLSYMDLFNRGYIKAKDILVFMNVEVEVQEDGQVLYNGIKMSPSKWAAEIKGYSTINIFSQKIYRKSDNKSLESIRNDCYSSEDGEI